MEVWSLENVDKQIVLYNFFVHNFLHHLGGNGKNMDKSIETRRSQADVKSVEAALNLQSRHSAKQSENTDESATLTSTEDDANEDVAKQSDDLSEKAAPVSFICFEICFNRNGALNCALNDIE